MGDKEKLRQEQKNRRYFKVLLFVSLIVSLVIFSSVVSAATLTDTIRRGEEKGWFLDPGKTLTVYYYADGMPAQVSWKNNWFYWWNNQPTTFIHMYTAARSSGPWYYMYSDAFAPYYRSFPLRLSRGVYKFEIKNYKKGDIVYLKIR